MYGDVVPYRTPCPPNLTLLSDGCLMTQNTKHSNTSNFKREVHSVHLSSFNKYEVVYKYGDSKKRYIARVVTNNINEYINEGNSQYISVLGFFSVDSKRSMYLTDKGISFEFVRYK